MSCKELNISLMKEKKQEFLNVFLKNIRNFQRRENPKQIKMELWRSLRDKKACSLRDKEGGGLCETRRQVVSARQGGRWTLSEVNAVKCIVH